MRDGKSAKPCKGKGSFWRFGKFLAVLFLSTAVFGCAGPGKETKEETEGRAAIKPPNAVEQQIARVQARLNSIDQKVQALEGESGGAGQRINQLSESVAKLSSAIAALGERIESQAKESKPKEELKPALKPKVEIDPVQLYTSAYEKFMAGRFDDSVADFRIYIQDFPKSDLADNAQYWIGESFFSQKKFEEAGNEFQKVVDLFPDGNKVPDAIYKKALSYIELGRKELAMGEFRQLLSKFPDSEAVPLAQEAIAKLEAGAR